MLTRKLVPLCIISAAALFAAVSWSAPALKEKIPAKTSEQEEAVEPGDAIGLKAVAARRKSSNNLKQLGLAILNYESAYQFLPQNIADKNGKPLLSWRVHLLPFIEQQPLRQEFKQDEPWDSEHNLKLLEKMPDLFSSPRVTVKKKGYTPYLGFQGKGAFFHGEKLTLASITDGTANTITIVESSIAVPWTKPVDLPFDAEKDLPDFGKAYGGRPLAALCDGSVRTLDLKKIKPATLKAAITFAGGEVLGDDWKP